MGARFMVISLIHTQKLENVKQSSFIFSMKDVNFMEKGH